MHTYTVFSTVKGLFLGLGLKIFCLQQQQSLSKEKVDYAVSNMHMLLMFC